MMRIMIEWDPAPEDEHGHPVAVTDAEVIEGIRNHLFSRGVLARVHRDGMFDYVRVRVTLVEQMREDE